MKNKMIRFFVVIVFFLQLGRGFYTHAQEPGLIPGGAMNDPIVVVRSALSACFLTWGLLELLFWMVSN